MALSLVGPSSGVAFISGTAFTYDTTDTASIIVLAFGSETTSSDPQAITSIVITDGSNQISVPLAQIRQSRVLDGSTTSEATIAWAYAHASWAASASLTGTVSWDGGHTAGSASGGGWVWFVKPDTAITANPFYAYDYRTDTTSETPWTPALSAAHPAGSIAFGVGHRTTSSLFNALTGSGTWTERGDIATGGGRVNVGDQVLAGAGTVTLTIAPATAAIGSSVMVVLFENTYIDITAFNGGSAVKQGDTAVPIVGAGLQNTGASAAMRIVSAPATTQAVSAYSASSPTAATCTIPTLTAMPFTSASWAIEVIGTETAQNEIIGTSITLNPATGYSVVEIVTAYLGSDSLLSFVTSGTPVATDQLEWDNTVVVDGTTCTITVNNDGTVSIDSSPDPVPATVTFAWRYWDSVQKLWSDWATATFGEEEAASTDDEFLFRRHRYLAFRALN